MACSNEFNGPAPPAVAQIIEIDRNSRFILDRFTLQEILKSAKGRHAQIISCVGPRNGRSYLLNFLLRALMALQQSDEDILGWNQIDQALTGFPWGNEERRHTQGILMTTEPIVLLNSKGEEVAVYLIDTQSILDGCPPEETSFVLGLCLQISSVVIFSVKHELHETQLTALSDAILQNQAANNGSLRQNIYTIIRDWDRDNQGFEFGETGGQQYAKSRFEDQPHYSEVARNTRLSLRQAMEGGYPSIRCFLLPSPGLNARKPNYNGNLNLSPKFFDNLELCLLAVFNNEQLNYTSMTENRLDGNYYFDSIQRYVRRFQQHQRNQQNNGGSQTMDTQDEPLVNQIRGLGVDPQNSERQAHDLCAHIAAEYRVKLVAALQSTRHQFMLPNDLLQLNSQLTAESIAVFTNSNIVAVPRILEACKHSLETELQLSFNQFSAENEARRNRLLSSWDRVYADALNIYQTDVTDLLKNRERLSNATIRVNDHENRMTVLKYWKQNIDQADHDSDLFREYECRLREGFVQEFKKGMEKKAERQFQDCTTAIARREYHEEMKNLMRASTTWPDEELKNFHRSVLEHVTATADLPTSDDSENPYEQKLVAFLETLLSEILTLNDIQRANFMTNKDQAVRPALEHYEARISDWMQANHCSVGLSVHTFEDVSKRIKQEATDRLLEKAREEVRDQNIMRDLVDELEKAVGQIHATYEQNCRRQIDWIKRQLAEVKTKAIGEYRAEMDRQYRNKVLIREQDVQNWHETAIEQIKVSLEQFSLTTEIRVEELQDQFMREIEGVLQEYNDNAAAGYMVLGEDANFHASNGIDAYGDRVLNRTKKWKSVQDFQSCHDATLEVIVREFKQNCVVKSDDAFLRPYLEQLRAETLRLYELEIAALRKRLGEEAILLQQKKHEIATLYEQEIEKHFRLKKFLKPAAFAQKSEKIINELLNRVQMKNLSQDMKQKLREALYPFYVTADEKNTRLTPGKAAIGIDLGTTYSCAGYFKGGEVHMIPSGTGAFTVPSFVAFTGDGELVGEAAKIKAPENPEHTIYDAKRLIGRRFDDRVVQQDINMWPFTVRRKLGTNTPVIVTRGVERDPEAISAKVLRHIRNMAEAALQESPITKCVITVPAYFNESQRRATKDAAFIAGIETLAILNEPDAAAIAYAMDRYNVTRIDKPKQNILVYDLGGGTFDVSILAIEGTNMEVLATGGDTHLGGADFDQILVEYCCTEFRAATTPPIDILANFRSPNEDVKTVAGRQLRRLREKCEAGKRILSDAQHTDIVLEQVYDKVLTVRVTRAKFEEINEELFRNTITSLRTALADARVGVDDIDEIIMVGGSTRIPKIRQLVETFFNGKQLNLSLDADQAVAQGAAIMAAKLSGLQEQKLLGITLEDVSPLSIGIELIGGKSSFVIPKNTKLPAKKTRENYTTTTNDQTTVNIIIYEGEDDVANRNHLLGSFTLTNIPPAPAGKEKVHVTMEMDKEGILHVTAKCASTGASNDIFIQENRGRLTRQQLNQLREEAEENAGGLF